MENVNHMLIFNARSYFPHSNIEECRVLQHFLKQVIVQGLDCKDVGLGMFVIKRTYQFAFEPRNRCGLVIVSQL